MAIKPFTCILLLLLAARASAQQDDAFSGFGVETNLMAGKIIKHTKKFTAPIPELSTAVDVNFVWQTYGKKEWHQRRNFPQIGLGMTLTDYGNNQVFGHCVGIYPNIQVPIVRGKKLEWTLRIGDGIAYVTKKYSRRSPADTVNTAIGSHINDFAIFMTDLRYHADDHWQLQAGVNFTHISNGYFRPPNLGVNMVGAHVGIQYFPATYKPKRIIRGDLPKLADRWLLHLRMGIGFNEANATGNPHLPVYIVSGYASRRYRSKNKIYGGIDYAYHEPTYAFYKTYGIHTGHERSNAWDGTFFLGHEFLIGRVGILTQVGYYYRTTYLTYGNDPFNQKFGANLYLIQSEKGVIKELFITALLNTHMAVAEYSEFGIGVGL
ncbi:MAG: secreted protein [Flavipsychrobacter sp.]|jgi:hypothetical protein|nr:secreted protein [Flavipsychrobacter sp.]